MTQPQRPFSLSTAIVYPNSRIHVGFAWECMAADWLARSHRLLGREVFFSSGMDEHSLNVQRAAEAKGLTPQAYCDEMARDITAVLDGVGVKPDRFIRTSDEDHVRVVQRLCQRVKDKGDFYQAKYEGHYCEGCEAYYTDKDLVDGKCPQHATKPKWVNEENWFFRLSRYQPALSKLFAEKPEYIRPEHRRSEILNFIQSGLKDFSVSRSTFTWGVPLPFDPKHVVYVWFDALINYVTAAGVEGWLDDPDGPGGELFRRRWPMALHIVGKDISRFHCIFWPAMLMAMELPLPDGVFIHGFITIRGARMSKSSGNVVAPDEVTRLAGADPFRYYMLGENQFGQDGNFAWDLLQAKVNADLANDWGNLVNRTISMARKYFPEGKLRPEPGHAASREVVEPSFAKFRSELAAAMAAVDPSAYIAACNARSRCLNLYIDQTKPWALAKAGETATLRQVLGTLLEGIHWTAAAYLSVLPHRMPEVFRQLGSPAPALRGGLAELTWGEREFSPGEPSPIFPRLELPAELLA